MTQTKGKKEELKKRLKKFHDVEKPRPRPGSKRREQTKVGACFLPSSYAKVLTGAAVGSLLSRPANSVPSERTLLCRYSVIYFSNYVTRNHGTGFLTFKKKMLMTSYLTSLKFGSIRSIL